VPVEGKKETETEAECRKNPSGSKKKAILVSEKKTRKSTGYRQTAVTSAVCV
jgi:hypothetical protein